MRVLIAADASDHGVVVAETARDLFGDDAEYVVVSVAPLTPPVGWSSGWGAATPMTVAAPLAGALDDTSWTNDVASLARSAGQHATEVSVRAPLASAEPIGDVGDPAPRILAAARAHEVDVIVVGWHDRSWFSRLVAPSVSREVVRHADVPVLVVR